MLFQQVKNKIIPDMKMKIAKLITSLAVVLLFGCNSNHQESNINLNDGEKWVVNAEMKPHIDKGNELLDNFIQNNGTDFLELANKLKAQNSALVQSCTMKGESHDELHKWLYPHMKLIDNLSKASSLVEANEIIFQLEDSFDAYQQHFK